jgi:hypothetical protein
VADERGWLIEGRHSLGVGANYWVAGPRCSRWTRDAGQALRFARQRDAEAFIEWYFFDGARGARAVEHMWPEVDHEGRCSAAASDPLRLPCITHTAWAGCPRCFAITCYRHTHAWWRGECP